MNKKRLVFAIATVLGAAAASWAVAEHRAYKRKSLGRLWRGSQVAETPAGPIEYATTGEGPPVLVIHGGAGGYDQGMFLARLLGDGYTFIAPSRFGYLRSPLRDDNSPEAQADAHAALLDALDIPKAVVIGFSAGGPSSIQFALRHRGRCRGLVLLSAVNRPFPEFDTGMYRYFGRVGRIIPDFVFWAGVKMAGLRGLFLFDRWTPETLALVKRDAAIADRLRRFIETALPISPRWAGTNNDFEQISQLALPLAQVEAPTLVIHGALDGIVPYAQGQRAAQHIPGAQLLTIEGGNHFSFATHTEQAALATREFLA